MKTVFFFFIITFGYGLHAQQSSKYLREVNQDKYLIPLLALYPNALISEQGITMDAAVLKFLAKFFADQSLSEFRMKAISKSTTTTHFLLEQYVNGYRVFNSCVKVNVDAQQRIYSMYYAVANIQSAADLNPYWSPITTYSSNTREALWVFDNQTLQAAYLENIVDKVKGTNMEYIRIDGNIVSFRDRNSYRAAHDTMVQGYIFNPDPLSPNSNVYGGTFVDNGDSSTAYFDASRVSVSVRAQDTLGVFYLRSPFCQIVEADAPIIDPATSLTGNFFFNRYDDAFEDFNVYYHINHFHDYISDSLGFPIANYPIQCDVHALNGADNSFFTFSTTPPSLYFGIGGVDDAEDADVIIHEYTHAISHDAAPFSNVGTERVSLDEGYGDYLACSYSKSITPFNAQLVFNWDGHNSFWSGRIVDGIKVYPRDIGGNIYTNGGIWSSALWEIESKIGREKGNRLALQSMYDNATNMTFPQAAINFIMADSNLYAGENYCKIVHSFIQRGMLDASYGARCDFTAVENNKEESFSVFNSYAFAMGTGDLYIQQREAGFDIMVMDMQGRTVYSERSSDSVMRLNCSMFSTGVYVIKLMSASGNHSIKVIKY